MTPLTPSSLQDALKRIKDAVDVHEKEHRIIGTSTTGARFNHALDIQRRMQKIRLSDLGLSTNQG